MVDEEGNVIDLTIPEEPRPAEPDDTTGEATGQPASDENDDPPDERSEA